MAIKMRVNKTQTSVCEECGALYKNTAEMYDLAICDAKFTLCKLCIEALFDKTLKASCMYNNKLKSQEDLKRATRESVRKGRVSNGSVL